MNRRLAAFLFLLLSLGFVRADDPKNHDLDVNYDEARIAPFEWPSSLVNTRGQSVTTPVEWTQQRRPELLSLFGNLIYGTVPQPESPIQVTSSAVKTNRDFLGGKAIRKDIRIQFENARGKAEMLVLVFVPNGASRPVPAMMLHTFDNTHGDAFDAHPDRPGYLRNGIPLAEILGHGLAFVAVFQGDLVGHNEVEFRKGIHPLFYHGGQSFPKASEWGCISAVAWGGSRALDYLETDPDIDAHRVALVGHSKMGKTTLWTAAQDERFAMAISAQSGCGGAAPWRRKYGETLEKLVTRFPYWLCRNAGKFVNNERDLPVDQHMLIACIAPRPVYICVAVNDRWADPLGEYQAAYQAGDVYRLLGKKPLDSATPPPVGEAILRSDVGYHCREGGHSVDLFDWQQFLAFTDHHFHSK
jgi:hypothetical protein